MDKLASSLGRNDEKPNIELAKSLCHNNDRLAIKDIISGLSDKNKAVANDCIKVLYEIGRIKPDLIFDYVNDFITCLRSKNNRLVWGGMIALAFIAPIKPVEVYSFLSDIVTAYKNGSIITVDNSISVFANLCHASNDYMQEIFPLLLNHLVSCSAKNVAQHAERIAICINADNREAFIKALDSRMSELSRPQSIRVRKLKI